MLTFAPQFERNGALAQLVEHRTENPCVPGSIPGGTTPPFISPVFRKEPGFFVSLFYEARLRLHLIYICNAATIRMRRVAALFLYQGKGLWF